MGTYEAEQEVWHRSYGHLNPMEETPTAEEDVRRWREWYEGALVEALKTISPAYCVTRPAPSQRIGDPLFTIRLQREPVAYLFPLREVEQTKAEHPSFLTLPWHEALVHKDEVILLECLRGTKLRIKPKTIDDFASFTNALEGRFEDILENNP